MAAGHPAGARSALDQQRRDFRSDYQDHGLLFCWENGKPPHPDTITRRFKRLTATAGLPEIDLHDVRRSYATAGRDAKIGWKALSKRIGHSDVAFTMKQYAQTDPEADRQVANTLAALILGGMFTFAEVLQDADQAAPTQQRAEMAGSPTRRHEPGHVLQIRLQRTSKWPLP